MFAERATRVLLLLGFCFLEVRGHGMLLDPPQRSSLWRFGFAGSVVNWNDNELNCGGFGTQWEQNDGKCGSCGDPYQGPRLNEAGGKYAKGIIGKAYVPGQTVTLTVDLNYNHLGYFEFRICPHNDVTTPVDPNCLNNNLLHLADGTGTRYTLPDGENRVYKVDVVLPAGMSCAQCVIQWKYHGGNSWGVDPDTGEGCMGCGAQEEFINCADVTIGEGATPHTPTSGSGGTTTPSAGVSTTPRPPTTTTLPPSPGSLICVAKGDWAGDPGMDQWCQDNCPTFCPTDRCECTTAP